MRVTGRVSVRIGDPWLVVRARVSMSVSTCVGVKLMVGVKTRVRRGEVLTEVESLTLVIARCEVAMTIFGLA